MTTAVTEEDKPIEGALVIESKVETPAPKPAAAKVEIPETPAVEDVKTASEPVVTYAETGDPGLDLALGFVGKLGIDDKHPAMVAAIKGDFELIKAHFAGLGEKAAGWERFVALAERSFKDQADAATKQEQATAAAVTAAVGGEDNWKAIQVWAAKEASPEEKREINAMFDAGPTQARAAAIMLKNLYDAKANFKPASATKKGASADDATTNTGKITRRELVAEADKLRRRLGPDFQSSPEYRALHTRLR